MVWKHNHYSRSKFVMAYFWIIWLNIKELIAAKKLLAYCGDTGLFLDFRAFYPYFFVCAYIFPEIYI